MLEEQKKKMLPIIIGGFVVGTIIILIFISLLTGGNKSDQKKQEVNTAPSATPQGNIPENAVTQNKDLVSIIDKESILRSTDSGDTFLPFFKIATTSTKKGFANVLTMNFHPTKKDTMIVTSYEDGLFTKIPEQDTWDIISFPPQKIYSFILDKDNPDQRMFASGIVDNNGRVFRTSDGGETWKAVYVEPGAGTVVTALSQDPRMPNVIYSGTSKGTIIKSLDGGNTWKNIGSKITGLIRYFSFDATKASVVYLLSFQQKMYYSPDKGSTWIDWENEKQNEVNALNDRANDLSRKGDTEGAKALREKASGLRTGNQENKMPPGINLIVSDPNISGTIYAGTGKGLFRSTDYGKYWTELDIIKSALGYPIRSIAVNPKNSNEILFVAGKAFYKTINKGLTWSVTPLTSDRSASFVAYDPYDVVTIYVGVSSI